MLKFDEHRPIPHSLSMWDTGTEILYKCARCGTDFRILSRQEKFCHGCGLRLDWSHSLKYCSEDFKKQYNKLVYEHHAVLGRNQSKEDNDLTKLMFDLYSENVN